MIVSPRNSIGDFGSLIPGLMFFLFGKSVSSLFVEQNISLHWVRSSRANRVFRSGIETTWKNLRCALNPFNPF